MALLRLISNLDTDTSSVFLMAKKKAAAKTSRTASSPAKGRPAPKDARPADQETQEEERREASSPDAPESGEETAGASQQRSSPFDASTYQESTYTDSPEQGEDDDPTAFDRSAASWRARPVTASAAGAASRAASLTPAQLASLRRHTINLNAGQFSTEGQLRTEPYDVEALFGEFIPQWIDQEEHNGPPRIVLYAHGGLVSEEAGAVIASNHIDYWLRNGIYPVYFIWETGLLESILQLWSGETRRSRELSATRGWFDDARDRAWEELSRALGGRHVWSGMKRSAERTFQSDGAGSVFVPQLRELLDQHDELEVHLIGHSAGSVFWGHGLSSLAAEKIPVQSLHLMAPAMTNQLFRQEMMSRIGKNKTVRHCTIYTMLKEFELDDTVFAYKKSLLYLIHHALETRRDTPVLGLEASLRADESLAPFFGLGSHATSAHAEVIWSVTPQATGRSASQATTHGMFDDDPATMESIVRRVKGLKDGQPVVRYFSRSVPLPEVDSFEPARDHSQQGYGMMENEIYLGPNSGGRQGASSAERGSSSKRALCIGIDNYPNPGDRLGGCVNDAREWQRLFQSKGFQTELMIDGQATRAGLRQAIKSMISGSRAGDVIAIQLSCHGTQVTDFDGDEQDDQVDEAVVPYDHRSEGYLIDDDIADIADQIPPGVNVSFFMDLCHSGSATRFALGRMDARSSQAKVRFLPADADMLAVHRRTSSRKRGASRNAYQSRPEILFSACAPHQTAKERNGQGDFTRYALQVLRDSGDQLTNSGLIDEVHRIGRFEDQDPALWAHPSFRDRPVLTGHEQGESLSGKGVHDESSSTAADALRDIECAVQRLRASL